MEDYVHGYNDREASRLLDQAGALTGLLHHDTFYPPGSTVLEAGCGVGAQTVILAGKSGDAHFTSIDVSAESIEKAKLRAQREGINNVSFQVGDVFSLPYRDGSFDHVFVCFLLEHLQDPLGALRSLRRVVKQGGSITVIEGDHGSAYFYPESEYAVRNVRCLVEVQARAGGDAHIGRRLYPLLTSAGFTDAAVSPRMVYVDASRPALVEGFTKNTFIAMVEGVGEQALGAGITDREAWQRGMRDLFRTAREDGTFCYTFFKARAAK
jgi:SAM-dependent methyltransferase